VIDGFAIILFPKVVSVANLLRLGKTLRPATITALLSIEPLKSRMRSPRLVVSREMKVSVPHVPKAILKAAGVAPSKLDSLEAAIRKVADFIRPGNIAVLTGAGVSVDSGIRAYRGHNGSYMNPNYR
jgi:hypothetical protein